MKLQIKTIMRYHHTHTRTVKITKTYSVNCWQWLKQLNSTLFISGNMCVCVCEVAQSCPTLCDPMDCSLPGSSLHGILQARVLELAAISFSRGSSQPRDRTQVSRIPGRCFNLWATREAPSGSIKWYNYIEEKNKTNLAGFLKSIKHVSTLWPWKSNSRYLSKWR